MKSSTRFLRASAGSRISLALASRSGRRGPIWGRTQTVPPGMFVRGWRRSLRRPAHDYRAVDDGPGGRGHHPGRIDAGLCRPFLRLVMSHWWPLWLAAGLAVETLAVIYNRQTLSETLRLIVNSPGRKVAWASFCMWGIFHIVE